MEHSMATQENKRVSMNNGTVHRISLTESVADVIVAATELYETRMRAYARAAIRRFSKDFPVGAVVGLLTAPVLLIFAFYGVLLNLLIVPIRANMPNAPVETANVIAHASILVL